jgi:chitodextrinase
MSQPSHAIGERHTPRRSTTTKLGFALAVVGVGVVTTQASAPVEALTSIVTVDSDGNVGNDASLKLDGSGNPVLSYRDDGNGDLKVVHCNDPNCAGGDESLVTVDSNGDVGNQSSLELDGSGNPVISYRDKSNGDLKVAHCNDPNCAGSDENLVAVDTADDVGWYTSLKLDGAGNPVISYWNNSNADLKLAHCNDPNCAGGDESILTVDSDGDVGFFTSLELDGVGNPVVSYYDQGSNLDLKLVHCNDPNCAGGDESILTVDSDGWTGWDPSLALDAAGNPVVSYWHDSGLALLHCNDPNCAGDDESILTVDSGEVGETSSLELDAAGNPVISHYDWSSSLDLKLVHCNDPNCAGNDDSSLTIDSDGDVGWNASLELDAAGNPVVSYYDATNDDLKLVHCDSPTCDRPNNAPVANADSYSTRRDALLVVAAPGVLSDDSDPDGDPLTAHLHDGAAHGALTLEADGSFRYLPQPGFVGTDQFTYHVSDATLDSPAATVTIHVTAVRPAAPAQIKAQPGAGQARLTWSPPASDGGATISDYVIQRSQNRTTWNTVRDGVSTARSHTVTGLSNGTRYWFRIAARNTAGLGAWSPLVAVTPRTVPTAPRTVTAAPASRSVTLRWSRPLSNGGATISDYVIERSRDRTTWIRVRDGVSTARSHTVTGLGNGTRYWFRVAARNAAGVGAWSRSVTAVPHN